MSAEDGTGESSMVSSMFLASWVDSSKDSEDVLSSEELAWIDSCLATDSDVLDSGWGALKDALTEVISFQSQPSKSISTADYDIHSTEESKTRDFAAETNNDGHHLFQLTEEEADDTETSPQMDNDVSSLKNVFLPNYKEFPEEALVDVDSDLLEDSEVELSLNKDIFKVWDLDIPNEEDEFEKQLNKALISEVEDKDLLDKLITGIADMSL